MASFCRAFCLFAFAMLSGVSAARSDTVSVCPTGCTFTTLQQAANDAMNSVAGHSFKLWIDVSRYNGPGAQFTVADYALGGGAYAFGQIIIDGNGTGIIDGVSAGGSAAVIFANNGANLLLQNVTVRNSAGNGANLLWAGEYGYINIETCVDLASGHHVTLGPASGGVLMLADNYDGSASGGAYGHAGVIELAGGASSQCGSNTLSLAGPASWAAAATHQGQIEIDPAGITIAMTGTFTGGAMRLATYAAAGSAATWSPGPPYFSLSDHAMVFQGGPCGNASVDATSYCR